MYNPKWIQMARPADVLLAPPNGEKWRQGSFVGLKHREDLIQLCLGAVEWQKSPGGDGDSDADDDPPRKPVALLA